MATSKTPSRASRGVRRPGDLVAAVAGLGVYLLSAIVASAATVPSLEQGFFHLINGLPDWLWWGAYPVQLLGVLVVPLGLAIGAALFRRWRLALALAALPVLKYIVEFGVVKKTVDRPRPFISTCAQDPACGVFRDVPLTGPSFVSGHAMIAGATAAILLPYLTRRWGKVVVVGLAIGVALGRVYLGAHNPLDVVGGLAAGVALGSLLNFAVGIAVRESNADVDGSGGA